MTATTGPQNDTRSLQQGVLILVVFGLSWAAFAVTGLAAPAVVTAVLIVLAAAVAAGVYRTARRWRLGPAATQSRPRQVSPNSRRIFNLVNAGQWVLILIAVFGLARMHRPGLIAPAICLVVGLHFLPLARIFDVSVYWWTATLLTVIAVAGGIAFAYDVDNAVVRMVVGFPAVVVLWTSALILAKRG
jgi:phage shock protein PspC (stress-responsive transcriptional regulator)